MERIYKGMIKKINLHNSENEIFMPSRRSSNDWRIGKTDDGEYFYYIDIKSEYASSEYEYSFSITRRYFPEDYVKAHVSKKQLDMFNLIDEITPYDGFFRIKMIPGKKPATSIYFNVFKDKKIGDDIVCINQYHTANSIKTNSSDLKDLSNFMNYSSEDDKAVKEKKDVIITLPELNPLFKEGIQWSIDVANNKFYIEIKNPDLCEDFNYQVCIHLEDGITDKEKEEKIRSYNCIESVSTFDGYARIILEKGVQCIDSIDIELKCM